jgi:CheY-like chemotaxis protein
MKILHLDDNKIFTDLFSKLLEMYDHECTVSNDGKTALQLTLAEKFDVVVLDLQMPEFSGHDYIDELDKLGLLQTQNIIILTGFLPDGGKRDDLLKRGIKACVEKPIRIEKFNAILDSLLINPTAN